MQEVADRISQRMSELNIKQADIMRATKAGRATVSSWVNGATKPSSDYLPALAKVLKTDPNWLLTGKDTPAQPVTPALPASSSSVIVLMDNLKEMESSGELTPAVVAAINGVIDAVKSASQMADSPAKNHQILDFQALQAEAMNNHGKD
ncbi:hypothetical protein A9308_00695 [Moraxella atlantae]|uniref:HTH cro/C1-type domain-containing protein n=1 Tax=Faucicola atlantae TaxID=34059 RepID=A0A1B8Q977_9GAMM|nr:helix-turn-helix domain-containing protein [Moraxella atlantae]OBX73760.1 hypothetical protein A9308_00695 [Moraxella atlantae]